MTNVIRWGLPLAGGQSLRSCGATSEKPLGATAAFASLQRDGLIISHCFLWKINSRGGVARMSRVQT